MKGAAVEGPLMRLASLLAQGNARGRRGERHFYHRCVENVQSLFFYDYFYYSAQLTGGCEEGKTHNRASHKHIDNLLSDFAALCILSAVHHLHVLACK